MSVRVKVMKPVSLSGDGDVNKYERRNRKTIRASLPSPLPMLLKGENGG